ncbi:MAG: hypothetical protein KIC90_01405, partial [Firmicutes bacterium]|nr:hypothetical protein [Bacillota bacterium]
PTKTEEWNITVTFVNYNANQTGNAGKSFNAKLMIQQESQSNQTLLADYVISQYTGTQGENSLYYHNSSLTNGAGDNSYRYAGASESVNNFVCFGSTTNPCPTDNLYRIIGVFEDKVKLIKYDYATSALLGTNGDYYGTSTPSTSYYKGSLTSIDQYYWNNATKKNTWSESNLNKINLNKNFINNIGSTWANKIATTTWKVGGNTSNNIAKSIPSVAYQNEIVAPVENITYDAKIGLMYVSDYGFAASPSAWTKTLHSYIGNDANGTSIKTINWMYMGVLDWTISLNSDNLYNAFDVLSGGYVDADFVSGNSGVRPSFNLLSSVKYVSGSGSMSDPVRVK